MTNLLVYIMKAVHLSVPNVKKIPFVAGTVKWG